ncbi:hypothetical protein ABKV19_007291 [Rosa sericea]
MAVELLGGAVFSLLYDGVKQAIGKTGTFKYLLRDIKSTLESLNKLHSTAIRQIGEYNLELGLPNDEIEDLREQMEEGAKLVCKLSNFRMWNYCCINCYTDQLVDLDRSLKRLLENLKLQETRDVKEILDLLRKYRIELDELKGMLKMLLQQRRGDVMETLTSTAGSSTEPMPQQSEGNGEEQASLGGGADLGAVYRMLLIVVTDVKDKNMMFRPLLGDLKLMLDSLKPLIEEIAEQDKVLVLPKEELEKFRVQMDKGVELVRKCSKVHPWASYKKYNYTIRLLGLNEYFRLQSSRLREQVARAVSETLASISKIKEEVKKIKGSGVIQNQLVSCEVPEPLLPTMQRESDDFVEVHPLPLPLEAKQPSTQVLITTKPESQIMKMMLSDVFDNPAGGAALPELLEHPMADSYQMPQPQHQTSAAQWYGSRLNVVGLGPLGDSNKYLSGQDNIAAHQHQHQQHQILTFDPQPRSPSPSAHSTSSSLHMLLPNRSSTTFPGPGGGGGVGAFGQLHRVRPDSHGHEGGFTTGPAPQLNTSNNPSGHLQHLSLSTSKYVKAAQELLEEICSVGRDQLKKNKLGQQDSLLDPSSNPAGTSVGGVSSSSSKDVCLLLCQPLIGSSIREGRSNYCPCLMRWIEGTTTTANKCKWW